MIPKLANIILNQTDILSIYT